MSEAMGKQAIREVIQPDQATPEYEPEPEEVEDAPEPEEAEIATGLGEQVSSPAEQTPAGRRAWDLDSFLAAVEADQGLAARDGAAVVADWARGHGLREWFGDGSVDASVLFMLDIGQRSCFTFGLRSVGGIELQLRWMRPPFDTDRARSELVDRLNGSSSYVAIPEDSIGGLPKLPWAVVEDAESRAAFLGVFNGIIQRTRDYFTDTAALDSRGVPNEIVEFIRFRSSGPVGAMALEFARRLAALGELELRMQQSKNEPGYFQVRSPRFPQVLAYVNVAPNLLRIDYRLPQDHEADERVVRRDNFYGISLRTADPEDLDLAMRLIDDALQRPE
jgi:hypothetical protein